MNDAVIAMDASCLVAAVCDWHEHNAIAARAVEDAFRASPVVIPAHALVEAYSVLTRLPSPNRLSPSDAWHVLQTSFMNRATVVALNPSHYIALVARASAQGIAGGRIYDEVIAESARLHATVFVTLNPRHFDPPPAGVRVIDPRGDDLIPR